MFGLPEDDPRSYAEQVAALSREQQLSIFAGMTEDEVTAALWDWKYWARRAQRTPPGDWRVWLVRAGRGFGKTRIGAEWVRTQVKRGCKRIALVAETAADARDVMVEGESGILGIHHPSERPRYEPSKRRLTWPNGAIATTYSADDPEQLRGPQHDAAWADEVAKWRYEDAWDQLMLGLRRGQDPRAVATTTLKPKAWIKRLMAQSHTVVSGGSTYDNRTNLPRGFLLDILGKYEGTRLGRQEIYGEYLDDTPGALWTRSMIDALRIDAVPEMKRVVVAVDPAVSSTDESDETGIVVVGIGTDNEGYVLADMSCRESPAVWAKRAINAYHDFKADRIIAEVNNGGDLVENVIRTIDRNVAYKAVRASRGKVTRAEPVAALYEQKRIHHKIYPSRFPGNLDALEDQMCSFTSENTSGISPDRVDALVWGLTELMVGDNQTGFLDYYQRKYEEAEAAKAARQKQIIGGGTNG